MNIATLDLVIIVIYLVGIIAIRFAPETNGRPLPE